MHTHLAEIEAQASLNTCWKGGLVAEMALAGLLDGGSACAHGMQLEPVEMETLARHDITLSQNPVSDLMLSSGLMLIQACLADALRLALGCDSANAGGGTIRSG